MKYKFAINVETCGNSTLCAESQLLLADIDIVDSQGNSLMSSNGDDSGKKKTLLKGETHLSLIEKKRKPIIAKKRLNQHNESDSSICTGKTRTLSCISKFQFNDVAYHHQKEFVKFKVGIYSLDGYSNKYPLLSMVSAPFQIYGRRTTEQRDEEVKKKRQYMEMKEKLMDEQPLDSMCSKKIKLQQSSEQEEALLKTYEKELQNLVALFQTLSPEEQLEAYNKTLISLIDLPQNQEQICSSLLNDPFEKSCDCMYWLVDNNCPNCSTNNSNDNNSSSSCSSSDMDFLDNQDCFFMDSTDIIPENKTVECILPNNEEFSDIFGFSQFAEGDFEFF